MEWVAVYYAKLCTRIHDLEPAISSPNRASLAFQQQADGALHARLNVTKARRRQCTLQAPALNDTYQNHNDRNDQQAVYQPAHRVRGDQTEQPQNNQNDRNAFKHFAAPCAVR
jgi:hypothetical protein